MELFALGARQRHRWVWPVPAEQRFDQALIHRVNIETGSSIPVLKYESPPNAKADRASSSVFASGTLSGNRLYACTYTEVIVFEVPSFKQVAYVSLPRFNSLHHVRPTDRGTILVVNTGLDEVVEMTLKGIVVREWSVLAEATWTRFSPTVDYRKVPSTKPHRSHPNYVFEVSNDVWVTRFHQKDAVCLTRPNQPINIALERPHDGVLCNGRIYFTTVDGHLVVADSASLQLVSTSDLRKFTGYPFGGQAWCRGLVVFNSRIVCVGFTRIRKTALMRSANWVKHGFNEVEAPTHLATFDLSKERCLTVVDLERHGMNLLFGVVDAEGLRDTVDGCNG